MMDDRTFEATPRRREQARRDGQSPRGTDVTAAAVLLTAILLVGFGGNWMARELGGHLAHSLQCTAMTVASVEDLTDVTRSSIVRLFLFVMPMALLLWVVAAVTQVGQVGWNWNFGKVLPDWNRIDPVAAIRRLASFRRWLEGILVMTRIAATTIVALGALWMGRNGFASYAGAPAEGIAAVAGNAVWVLVYLALTLAAVAFLDLVVRWWLFENSLKMTAEEAREELREQEGDLRVRALQRGAHQERVRREFRQVGLGEFDGDQAAASSRE